MRTGIYIDCANITHNGGHRLQYAILRDYLHQQDANPIRMNAYVTLNTRNTETSYQSDTQRFFNSLRECGFKVIVKEYKWYRDDEGGEYSKANADMDMAIDILMQYQTLERIILLTGDGDFVTLVRALQNQGRRVDVIAFDNVSTELKREADSFTNGYLIPNLVPIQQSNPNVICQKTPWGEVGSRVRGVCTYYDEKKHHGFLRFVTRLDRPLWVTDTRHPNSPFESAIFFDRDLRNRSRDLPSYHKVFEFTLALNNASENNKEKWQATDIEIVTAKPYTRSHPLHREAAAAMSNK